MTDPLSEVLNQVLGALLQSVFESIFKAAGRRANNRSLAKHLADPATLLGRIEPEVAALRAGELADVPDHEWAAALHAVRDSFALVTPIDVASQYRLLRDADTFAAHVTGAAAGVRAAAGLGESGEAAYRLLLSGCCAALVRQIAGTPDLAALMGFLSTGDADRAMAQVLKMLGAVLGQEQVERLRFEQRYLDHVAETMSNFELFGVTSGRAPTPHSFDRYYVSLALTRRSREAGEHGLTGAGTDGLHAITDTPRVLLHGGAGAGKTTFLTRLRLVAARGARSAGTAQWPDTVPFFVPLRRFATGELPAPEDLVGLAARALAGEKPARWVSSVFHDGRGLLLVDGMDELTADRRAEALDWLDDLLATYPKARYVLSSRPSAVDQEWLARNEFAVFDLMSLSEPGVRDFVHNWHEAAREGEPTQVERDWLALAETRLLGTLSARPELRKIASSPLLCGLICALHRRRDMSLPMDRRGLFDAALNLLLVRWDEVRGVEVGGAWPRSEEEQLVLLQRLAASMVANGEIVLTRADASSRFGSAIRGLRSLAAEPEQIMQQALERTGLLREPEPERVQFVHRTFRDYLAARHFVDESMTGLLVEHAHEDPWREVVVMAVAHARPKERAAMLAGLLGKADSVRRKDPRLADRFDLVAAVCLEEAQVIDPEAVRQRVQAAVRRLIPPATFEDADALARAGEFVMDLLPGPEEVTDDEAARVVYTAARIGGPRAWAKIAPFATVNQPGVIDQLLSGWRWAADPEEYARLVLSQVDFGDLPVPVRRWERFAELRHLPGLGVLRCIGNITPLDPLADVKNLRELHLVANEVVTDLRPLAANRSLRTLVLRMCDALEDLSPLADSAVEELSLHLVDKADLGTLRGAPLRRLTIQHPALAAGLAALPADLPLRELTVDNRPSGRRLVGLERRRTLEKVTFSGAPHADEVAALAELPALRHLVVHRAGPVERLAELGAPRWPALRALDVHVTDDAEAGRAEAALGALHGVELGVWIGDRRWRPAA